LAGLLLVVAFPSSSLADAKEEAPDFKEVFELVKSHVSGLSEEELNRAAVQGLLSALGPKVSGLSVGEKITALLPGGGYAGYALVAAPLAMPIPKGLNMVEAAAIPETFLTVWTNLFERGRCKAGDVVLVHGGTSGIGTAAIQLATAWGASVYATAGTEKKARACEALGAVRGIDDFLASAVQFYFAEQIGRELCRAPDRVQVDGFDA